VEGIWAELSYGSNAQKKDNRDKLIEHVGDLGVKEQYGSRNVDRREGRRGKGSGKHERKRRM